MGTVMGMDMTIPMKTKMIDIHNHMIYGVDDGSSNIEITKKMIKDCYEQGIKSVFLTPHVNSSVSFSSREEHIKKYLEIKKIALEYDIDLHLGAEIYVSFKIPEIDFKKYTMGKSNVLLIEFSPINKTPICDLVYELMKKNFVVIVAHIERYNYLSFEDFIELKQMGAYLQVNASTVMRKGKSKTKDKIMNLIKYELIDFIASDSHNNENRSNKMKLAYDIIKKRFSKEKAMKLFYINQSEILMSKIQSQ